MGLLAEERKLGTDELIMTAPVGTTSIVVGKYLAAVLTYLVYLAISLIYPVILIKYGSPDMVLSTPVIWHVPFRGRVPRCRNIFIIADG